MRGMPEGCHEKWSLALAHAAAPLPLSTSFSPNFRSAPPSYPYLHTSPTPTL